MFRHMITKLILNLFIIGCLLTSPYTFAQNGQSETPRVWGDPDGFSGDDCETTMMILDFVAIADRESGNNSQVIIIIARLGREESSHTLIRRRLRQVADYLNRRVPQDRVITAEAERVNGLGQVEFYVGGKLHTIIKMKRNRDLAKGCYSG